MANQAEIAQALQSQGVQVFGLKVKDVGGTTEVRGMVQTEADRKKAEQAISATAGAGRYVNAIEVQVPVGGTAGASGGAGTESYVVKTGDTLSKIAARELGDGSQWKKIWEANRDQIPNPDLIHPGQRLVIPK